MKHDDVSKSPRRAPEAGFALILAILALMLLTFLGLTLATTTSTELQIAANYKWSQQALFNAEAGIEVGKAVLRNVPNWSTILPAPRAAVWDGSTAPGAAGGGAAAPYNRNDAYGNVSRNWESWGCDSYSSGMGLGVVLDDGGATAPYQYKTSHSGQTIPGAFTLWVRRPTFVSTAGTLNDYGFDNENLILVSEGVAPFGVGGQGRAMRVIEVALSKSQAQIQSPCGTRGGQSGGGPEGANFSACDAITGSGLTGALGITPAETAVR